MALDDFSTPTAQVRALIPDIDLVPNPNDPDSIPAYMLSDKHITALLAQSGGNPVRAAAWACDLIAMSEAIIAKVITTEDLSTDGAKLMNAMTSRSVRLFAMADRADEADEEGFVITNFVLTGHAEPR